MIAYLQDFLHPLILLAVVIFFWGLFLLFCRINKLADLLERYSDTIQQLENIRRDLDRTRKP